MRENYRDDIGTLEQFVERPERVMDREKSSGATIVVDFYGGVAGLVASRVFSRLGVSAAALEGFANAAGEAGGTGLEESVERVARIVSIVDAAFGAVVGREAEYVQFVDDGGEWVPNALFYVYAEAESGGGPPKSLSRSASTLGSLRSQTRRCSQAKIALEVQGGLYSVHG